jgi:hypothetical protein
MAKDYSSATVYDVLYQCNAVVHPLTTGEGLVDKKCGNLQCQPGRCSRCGQSSSIAVFVSKETDIPKDKHSNTKRARESKPSTSKS